MTKKDFFRVLIKIFGLYSLIIAVFTVFPSQLSFVLYDFGFIAILYILVILTFIGLAFLFLIKKPDKIIQWLKLDSGFEEERIHFKNLTTTSILQLSTLIVGGLLIIDNVPTFLSHTYFAFKTDISRLGLEDRHYINWGISFIKLIIGYFLVTNFTEVSKWFKNKEEL